MAAPLSVSPAGMPVLRVSPGDAASAYARTMSGSAGAGGPGFAAVLSQAVDGAIATSADAEQKAAAAMQGGNVSVTDVVTSVERADATLQTAVALRDRVVQAWQTIMQMAI